jgi:hypothetical protein
MIHNAYMDEKDVNEILALALANCLDDKEGVFIQVRDKKYLVIRQREMIGIEHADDFEHFKDGQHIFFYNKNLIEE